MICISLGNNDYFIVIVIVIISDEVTSDKFPLKRKLVSGLIKWYLG